MKPPDFHQISALEVARKSRPLLGSRGSLASGLALSHRFSSPAQEPLVTLRMGDYDPRIHLGFIRAGRELGWDFQEIREFSQDSTTPWRLEMGKQSIQLYPEDSHRAKDTGGLRVGLPFQAAGALAAKHLLASNFPNLAFYRSIPAQRPGRLFKSFSRACSEAGQTVLELSGDFSPGSQNSESALARLRLLPLPCAVLAASDEDAAVLVNAAISLGISIPSELAVLGCGDHEISRAKSGLDLSSIDLNHELAGYTTAKLFSHLLTGDPMGETSWTVKPGGLIERETTRSCLAHPGISHVISRIERDFAEPLTVPQLAREAGMSVRTLQRLYHTTTGSAICEDLLNQRLEGASKLLRDSDLKLEAVARMVGLGNASRLCRLFRARFGRTPNQCRVPAAES